MPTTPPSADARLITLRQAATHTGISYSSFRRLVQAGKMPVVRLPSPHDKPGTLRRTLIDRHQLDLWISLHRQE